MSIQGMRKRFAIHLRYILYVIIALFVLTLPLVFAPSPMGSRDREWDEQGADQETIAKVNGSAMVRGELERQFDRSVGQMLALYEQIGQGMGVDGLWRYRLDAFEEAVTRHVLLQQARKQGISVSDREVRKTADKQAQQQVEQLKLQYKDQPLDRLLAQMASRADGRARERMSERSFRKWLAQRLQDDHGEDLREDLILERLRQQVVGRVSAGEQELVESYDRVTLREILVSLHPTGRPALTDEQARKRAEELTAKARQGADFEGLVLAESDDPQAEFTRGQQAPMAPSRMSPERQQAVANLKVGDISDPVKTPTGYLIAKVEKRARELPADFQKNKGTLLKQYVQQKQSQAWDSYGKELRQKAKVEVTDSELLAYQALVKGSYEQALPLLKKAAETADAMRGTAAGSVYYQLATALSQRAARSASQPQPPPESGARTGPGAEPSDAEKLWKEAAEAYAKANDALSSDENAPGSARAQALMGMGRCYESLKDYEEAATWYQAAGDATEAPGTHQQLLPIYQRMGRQELVAREQQWLADYQKAEEERRKVMEEQQRKAAEEAAKKRPQSGGVPGTAPPAGSSSSRGSGPQPGASRSARR